MDVFLLQHFERMCLHRTDILEGIRTIAFRNMDHLTRAMKREGIHRFTTPASIITVEDAMVRDQGLEPTPTHRWLLEAGTHIPWEIYLCLLFAEVESYRSMSASFAFPPLDKLIDLNRAVLNTLKILRDKLLHPTKDVPYEKTLARYFREVKGRYPAHFHFAADLQVLLDRYLHDLKNHLVEAFADETAQLPDNKLHAFFALEESGLKHALAEANNTVDKNAIGKLLLKHHGFVRGLKIDPGRRDDPLTKRQEKQIRDLYEFGKLLAVTPLPTPNYRSPAAVQPPMHDTLSTYIPVPLSSDTQGFYRGSPLPPRPA